MVLKCVGQPAGLLIPFGNQQLRGTELRTPVPLGCVNLALFLLGIGLQLLQRQDRGYK